MSAQLDMFEDTELAIINENLRKTKELSEKTHQTSENVRKGVFAKVNHLEKFFLDKFLKQDQKITHLEELIKSK